jgi:hypothetical protein
MPRPVSSTLRASVFAQNTEQVYLALLVISHADITTLRFVCNTEDITSNGSVYTGYPFDIHLPQEREDQPPQIPITIDNVDRAIVDEIRSLVSAPDISLTMVLASSPDTIEYGPVEATLRNVQWNLGTITGDLQMEDLLNESYPGYAFTPQTAPGLFS